MFSNINAGSRRGQCAADYSAPPWRTATCEGHMSCGKPGLRNACARQSRTRGRCRLLLPREFGSPEMSQKPLSAAAVQARIDRSPFNRWLQLRVSSVDEGGIELEIRSREELTGNPDVGAIHGGILASLVDVTGTMSVIAQTGNSVVTVDLRTDYHRPALGAMLWARGTIVKFGRQLSSVDVRILDSGKRLIASGRVVLMNTAFSGASGGSEGPSDA